MEQSQGCGVTEAGRERGLGGLHQGTGPGWERAAGKKVGAPEAKGSVLESTETCLKGTLALYNELVLSG